MSPEPLHKNDKEASFFSRIIIWLITISLVISPSASIAQSLYPILLPVPGARISLSATYAPTLLKGITLDPNDPLKFNFIVDSGHTNQSTEDLKEEANKLIKYFLASLTMPKNDLWVNLSPVEQDRIIPNELAKTELGRDMLSQDYLLKQLTASLAYPENEIGQEFWNRIQQIAKDKYGTSDIPAKAFNKVWITPDTATIFESGASVYIIDAHLKVMMEQDYMILKDKEGKVENNQIMTDVFKEIILPEIEKEVNNGKNFANLRQIYYSLILAKWYKENIKNSLLSQEYVDQKKIQGIDTSDESIRDHIYEQYIKAFKTGVYDYIKEEYDEEKQRIIPKQYFSGGISDDKITYHRSRNISAIQSSYDGPIGEIEASLTYSSSPSTVPFISSDVALLATSEEALPLIAGEISYIVKRLASNDIYPTVHGEKLSIFGDDAISMLKFIQRFSVLKNPDDIRRVLLWKHNVEFKREGQPGKGRALSNLEDKTVNDLYNAVFNQGAILNKFKNNNSENEAGDVQDSLNVTFFRRGRSGHELTRAIKSLRQGKNPPNVNIQVIVSATDDGESWFHAAREFNAPGIPGAGKALIDLQGDHFLSLLLEQRFDEPNRNRDEMIRDFGEMLQKLKDEVIPSTVQDSFDNIIVKANTLNSYQKQKVIGYLTTFHNFLIAHRSKHPESEFTYNKIPLRSIVILGAAMQKEAEFQRDGILDDPWQAAIDELSKPELLNLRPGDKVILPTKKRQQIVGVASDGTIYFSESGLNEHLVDKNLLGIWLIDEVVDDKFISVFEEANGLNYEPVDLELAESISPNMREAVNRTVRKVSSDKAQYVAEQLSRMSTTGKLATPSSKSTLSSNASEALENADIILYSDAYLETNVGGALIVPGMHAAIEKNENALKINLNEISTVESKENKSLRFLDKVYRYITGKLKHITLFDKETGEMGAYLTGNHGWKGANKLVDYVLVGLLGLNEPDEMRSELKVIEEETEFQVNGIAVSAEENTRYGFYSSKSLGEAIISLYGIKKAKYEVSDNDGLMPISLSKDKEVREEGLAKLGLFRDHPIVSELLREIGDNWTEIQRKGAFAFDVDMTLLPKNAEGVTIYKELANVFTKLLRKGIKVAIISGNSEEEQEDRIENAIKEEMKDNLNHMQNLFLYYNGGATKITFDSNGIKVHDEDYREERSISTKELAIAVNNALDEAQRTRFGYTDDEIKILKAIISKSNDYASKKSYKFNEKQLLNSILDPNPGEQIKWDWLTPKSLKDIASSNEQLELPFTRDDLPTQKKYKVQIPWIEKRGEFTSQKTGQSRIASITIKPLHEVPPGDDLLPEHTVLEDARQRLIKLIEGNLGSNKSVYNINPGGSSSIDITLKKSSKPAALLDFISHAKEGETLTPEHIYYFGDEFFKKPDKRTKTVKRGNDEAIAELRDDSVETNLPGRYFLRRVNTVAVNADNMEGATSGTRWIGRTPQATLEFLEALLTDKVELSAIQNEDKAMLGNIQSPKNSSSMNDQEMLVTNGGIDLNEVSIQREGNGINIHYSPESFNNAINASVEGFIPVIINYTPITSVLPLLGLEPNRPKADYEVSSIN